MCFGNANIEKPEDHLAREMSLLLWEEQAFSTTNWNGVSFEFEAFNSEVNPLIKELDQKANELALSVPLQTSSQLSARIIAYRYWLRKLPVLELRYQSYPDLYFAYAFTRLCARMGYYKLKIQWLNSCWRAGLHTEETIFNSFESMFLFLEEALTSGLIDNKRKQLIRREYGLLEASLLLLNELPVSLQRQGLIQRVFALSKKGEEVNNLRLLSSGKMSTQLARELIREIGRIEHQLMRHEVNDSAHFDLLKYRNRLKFKYIQLLDLYDGNGESTGDKGIKEGTLFISFFQGKTTSFQWLRSEEMDVLRLHSTAELSRLTAQIDSTFNNLSLHLKGRTQPLYELRKLLKKTYQKLGLGEWVSNYSRLLIDTDGVLGLLPFEAIIGPDDHYLFEKVVVNYKGLKPIKHRKLPVQPQLTWLAGQYQSNLLHLDKVNERAEALPLFYVVESHAATTLRLLDDNTGELLHLAVHLVNDVHHEAYLLLNERDTLYRHQWLPNWKNTQQLILNVCGAQRGPIAGGGMSLTMANKALESGLNSLISTLWQVEDGTAAAISNQYLLILGKGLASPAALNKAKISFLEAQDAFRSHPFFWSPFIHIGDEVLIEQSKPKPIGWQWPLLCMLLLLFLEGFYTISFRHSL